MPTPSRRPSRLREWFRRTILRRRDAIERYACANPKVCMVVWNTFEHDARVTREARSLARGGKRVTVVAVHDPIRTAREEHVGGGGGGAAGANDGNGAAAHEPGKGGRRDGSFRVLRVSRAPFGTERLRSLVEKLAGTPATATAAVAAGAPTGTPSPPPGAAEPGLVTAAFRRARAFPRRAGRFLRRGFTRALRLFVRTLGAAARVVGRSGMRAAIAFRFACAAFRERAGVYHAHDLNTLGPVFLVSRLRGAKLVYDAHEVSIDRTLWRWKRLWKVVERLLIRRADAVLTTSDTRAEFFARTYGVRKPAVVRNATESVEVEGDDRIRRRLGLAETEPVILYQGGLQVDRGLEQLIEAMREVPRGTLVFMGAGALREMLVGLAAASPAAERIRFLPMAPLADLLRFTASADIGCQVLRNTCFNHWSTDSNKIFEYMMSGLAVVSSDFPELGRIVRSADCGILIDPERPAEIAAALRRLVDEPALRRRLGANAREAARTRFHWGAEEPALLGIYGLEPPPALSPPPVAEPPLESAAKNSSVSPAILPGGKSFDCKSFAKSLSAAGDEMGAMAYAGPGDAAGMGTREAATDALVATGTPGARRDGSVRATETRSGTGTGTGTCTGARTETRAGLGVAVNPLTGAPVCTETRAGLGVAITPLTGAPVCTETRAGLGVAISPLTGAPGCTETRAGLGIAIYPLTGARGCTETRAGSEVA